jgi:hypothetical protein
MIAAHSTKQLLNFRFILNLLILFGVGECGRAEKIRHFRSMVKR